MLGDSVHKRSAEVSRVALNERVLADTFQSRKASTEGDCAEARERLDWLSGDLKLTRYLRKEKWSGSQRMDTLNVNMDMEAM